MSTVYCFSSILYLVFFFSSRRRHTRCALVTGVQTCALPISCYEVMRDTAAAHYIRETGRSWIPSTGNRISLGVTSAIVDGRAFLQARRERVRDANKIGRAHV